MCHAYESTTIQISVTKKKHLSFKTELISRYELKSKHSLKTFLFQSFKCTFLPKNKPNTRFPDNTYQAKVKCLFVAFFFSFYSFVIQFRQA